MSLKNVIGIAFVALVLFFLFGTLAMAWDWPTTLEYPRNNVNILAPSHNPWQVQLYEHTWEEAQRPWPARGRPDQELERPWPTMGDPWQELQRRPTMAHAWGEE